VRRIAGLLLGACALVAVRGTTAVAVGDAPLFTVEATTSGPVVVPAGQSVWRDFTVRNESDDDRVTVSVAGAGRHAAWLRPAVSRLTLEPASAASLRVSINPPPSAAGSAELVLRVALVVPESRGSRDLPADARVVDVVVPAFATAAAAPSPGPATTTAALPPSRTAARSTGTGWMLLAGVAVLGAVTVTWSAMRTRVTRRPVWVFALDVAPLNQALGRAISYAPRTSLRASSSRGASAQRRSSP
jgi:hypothetical protein